MESRSRKTLNDFPQFVATALRRGPLSESGYSRFVLEGYFDRAITIEPTGPHWFWLLYSTCESLCASVQELDEETRAAVLTFEAIEEPPILGKALAYLSPCWQAFNVWMVLDPEWGWQKKQFVGLDAVAEDFQSKDTSFVGGREVKLWTKLSPVRGGESRLYPAVDQSSTAASAARPVPLGWDHEHCELCNAHIDVGMFGYCDQEDRWMCEKCYDRYVESRDLAFVDEL